MNFCTFFLLLLLQKIYLKFFIKIFSYCFSNSGQFESCCRILSVGELNFLNAIAHIQQREDEEGHKMISFWLPKFVLFDAFKQCIQIASGLEKAGYYIPLRYINKDRTKEFFNPTIH